MLGHFSKIVRRVHSKSNRAGQNGRSSSAAALNDGGNNDDNNNPGHDHDLHVREVAHESVLEDHAQFSTKQRADIDADHMGRIVGIIL